MTVACCGVGASLKRGATQRNSATLANRNSNATVTQRRNMNKIVKRDANGRWLPGSASPSPGRPVSSRQKIAEALLADLAEVWAAHGKDVLLKLAVSDPGKLATIAYGLLPKDIFVSIEHKPPGNISPDDWAIMVELVALARDSLPPNAKALPKEVADVIEHALRSHFAAPVCR
jgi:hypothetical protein